MTLVRCVLVCCACTWCSCSVVRSTALLNCGHTVRTYVQWAYCTYVCTVGILYIRMYSGHSFIRPHKPLSDKRGVTVYVVLCIFVCFVHFSLFVKGKLQPLGSYLVGISVGGVTIQTISETQRIILTDLSWKDIDNVYFKVCAF